MKSILLFNVVFLLIACTQTKTGSRSGPSSHVSNNLSNLSSSTTESSIQKQLTNASSIDTGTSTSTVTGVAPSSATASINTTVNLAPSDIVSDPTNSILFPQIQWTKTNADYIKLLRCAASYNMTTLQGDHVQKPSRTLSNDDLKWAWSQAINDNHNCKIVSEYLTVTTYIDMPAPTGSFYYIANPCINSARSTTGQEGCSNALTFTKPLLDYANTFIDQMRQQAIAYASAQDQLYSDLDDVRTTAIKLKIRLNLCDQYYAFTETEHALQRGLVMLGLTLAGGAVGYQAGKAIKMIGPAGGAMQLGLMSQMMGGEILNKILGISPQVNSCIYGSDSLSQQGLKEQAAIQEALNSANMYEGMFHVKETLDHFSSLIQAVDKTHPAGGVIAQDMTRLQTVMAQMNAINQKIISVDSLIAQGNAFAQAIVNEVATSTNIDINTLLNPGQ